MEAEEVAVEAEAGGGLLIKDVEAGYIYGITAEWDKGQAEYGFITKAIEE